MVALWGVVERCHFQSEFTVMDCEEPRGNKVMSMRTEDKLI